MECISKLYRLPCTENSFLTEKCPFRTHPYLYKHLCHTVTGIKIVIYNQRLKTFQFCNLLYSVMLWLKPKWKADYKFGAFSLHSLNLNGTAHHIHNILGNGHAKSCTLSPADCGSTLSLKRRKNLLYKFLTHADSVILYTDLVQSTVL